MPLTTFENDVFVLDCRTDGKPSTRHSEDSSGVIGGNEPRVPAYWSNSVEMTKAWERTLHEARTPHTRRVALRTSMVMSLDRGGVFDVILQMTRFGLGGAVAGGKQFVSWIHDHDFIRAVDYLITHEALEVP